MSHSEVAVIVGFAIWYLTLAAQLTYLFSGSARDRF